MAEEKEYKYVVRSDAWRDHAADGVQIRQGYLSTDPDRSVRIRVTPSDAVVTIKAPKGASADEGLTRAEFEYLIPLSDAEELLESVCSKPIIEKTRYRVSIDGFEWDVDEFEGENKGLVLAELETQSEAEPVKPDWVGEDVSSDSRYQNANLVEHPYRQWGMEEEPEFHFKHGETIREACVRIICGEIDSALRRLSDPSAVCDEEAIHEARKSVKKVRATLRLVQPALGAAYGAANQRLRDVGRTLSSVRDAHALSELLDELTRKAHIEDRVVRQVQQALREVEEERRRQVQEPETWDSIRAGLLSVKQEVEAWNLPDSTRFSGVEEGLRKAYQRGRRAFRRACDDPDPEHLHEWRKRAKDHWYHLRLLRKSWPEVLEGYVAALDQLESSLGDDHNLVVLEQFLAEHIGEDRSGTLSQAIHDRRAELLGTARTVGKRVYSERPGEMVWRMARVWKAWHSDR